MTRIVVPVRCPLSKHSKRTVSEALSIAADRDAELTALRLLETPGTLYPLDFDAGPLREFADSVRQYYADHSERLDRTEPGDRSANRMYV